MDKPKELLSYTLWLQLDHGQKSKLVKLFSIPRTGEVVVSVGGMTPQGNIGGVAQQDGHKPEDLYAITSDRMIELLNENPATNHNFYALWDALINNLDVIYIDQYSLDQSSDDVTAPTEEIGEPPVGTGHAPVIDSIDEDFVPRDPEELIKPKAEEAEAPKEEKNAKTTKAKSSKTK